MRDIYMYPTVAGLAEYLSGRNDLKGVATETCQVHRASNFAYWLTGAAQLASYLAYAYVGLWLFNDGLNWVYDKLDSPVQLYLRCAMLAAAVFFGMSGFAIAAKWILVGRWKQESFPIWGWRYYRFWVVKTLIRTAPATLFRGSPLYSLYLRLLGAKLGHSTVIECRTVPVCTDLISIGENSILRKDSMILGYRAQSGYIHTGPLTIGRNAFVGVGCTLDIDTRIGDGAQLGPASSLQRGQCIPDGERWHGSPAVPGTGNYCDVPILRISRARRIAYEVMQLIGLFALVTPLPFLFQCYWENVGDAYQETIGLVAVSATVVLFAYLALSFLAAVGLPRLVRPILQPDRTYRMYGLHYWLQTIVEFSSNSRLLNLLFGDSSAVVYYMRAIG
ncbi:hypothetical protein COL154_014163, partial [Colletotrichum chrysophilum]